MGNNNVKKSPGQFVNQPHSVMSVRTVDRYPPKDPEILSRYYHSTIRHHAHYLSSPYHHLYQSYHQDRLSNNKVPGKNQSPHITLSRSHSVFHHGFNGFNDKHLESQSTFQPVTIEWQELSVSVRPGRGLFKSTASTNTSIPIIKNVTGSVESGHLLAIMGASGAGKTTFLNVLTGRNLRNLDVGGKVLLNGQIATADKMAACSAYVQQDDMFIGVLTVREHLTFQAHLRTSDGSDREIKAKVDNVILELGLKKIENFRIGSPGMDKSISGGEMKRLAFASEILTDPSILFCDEPTSGLDSFMAQSVVSVLRSMAATRRTILATIHQPSSQVFEMFDEILLLSQGRVAFMGSSADALIFFSRIGLRCPSNYNPADFYVQQLAIIPGKEDECKRKVSRICSKFSESVSISRTAQAQRQIDQKGGYKRPIRFSYKRGFCTQIKWVVWRSWLTNLRDPLLTFFRVAQTIFVALLLGVVYWKQEYSQEGIMNINGALFILLANVTFTNVFAVVNTFCLELPIFIREYGNGLYSIAVYFLSKLLAELPYFVFLPFGFAAITYWMIGLYDEIQVFYLTAMVLVLIANVACGFGYFISCISKSVTMGLSIAPPFMIPLMLFGGLFLNNKSIPHYLAWIKYLSWFYYGNEILVVNQWRKVTNISCDIPDSDHLGSLVGALVPNMTEIEGLRDALPPGLGCILDGKGVIERLHFDENNVTFNFIALGVLLVAFRVLAFIAITIRAQLFR
ncbi:protein white-like isoform X1 [Panonychus citri]|uniref:protein white-like isoform X1 n=1 Tax=Panonychus citri TaxID=50023 RepID=UPI002307FD18|nr:protein white-like isoform X1 [Panonychus citri]